MWDRRRRRRVWGQLSRRFPFVRQKARKEEKETLRVRCKPIVHNWFRRQVGINENSDGEKGGGVGGGRGGGGRRGEEEFEEDGDEGCDGVRVREERGGGETA